MSGPVSEKTRNDEPSLPASHPKRHSASSWLLILLTLSHLPTALRWYSGIPETHLQLPKPLDRSSLSLNTTLTATRSTGCRPPLPHHTDLPFHAPLGLPFRLASRSLDAFVTTLVKSQPIDSLVLGVVTPSGLIFEGAYGSLKANGTADEKKQKPDVDSVYRIASISKMFAAFEAMIMKEQGKLGWDDPVAKHIPNFTYNAQSWSEYLDAGKEPVPSGTLSSRITIRQLASHTSGIERDFPPPNLVAWPKFDLSNITRPEGLGRKQLFRTVSKIPLIAPPYSLPAYSNTGFSLLTEVLVAASGESNGSTYSQLAQKDIFDPLDLDSAFNVTNNNRERLAIPSTDTQIADFKFGEVQDGVGGQYSSLKDLTKVMKTFLQPSKEESLLSPHTMREWLRPLHAFPDDVTEVGYPWEIRKVEDTFGRVRRWYGKAGDIEVYHSHFVFNPSAGFGVIVLLAGTFGDTQLITGNAIKAYQPAFDLLHARVVAEWYAGEWISDDGRSRSKTVVDGGSLYMTKLVLNGTDVFEELGIKASMGGLGMWSVEGRPDEFRVSIVPKNLAIECFSLWSALDGLYARGAPLDLVLFEGMRDSRLMKVPSVKGTLRRI